MTETVSLLFILGLFLLTMTTLAALRDLPLLAETHGVLIISQPILGAQNFTVMGHTTNIGSIFFAAVVYGLSLKYLRYGAKATQAALRYILFALTIEFGSILILQEAGLLNPVFATSIRIAGASFFSFWLTLLLFVGLLDRSSKAHPVIYFLLITVAMEGLSSLIFFPAAFGGDLSWAEVLGFALTGWAAKSCLAFCSLPFLAGFLWSMRKNHERPGGPIDPALTTLQRLVKDPNGWQLLLPAERFRSGPPAPNASDKPRGGD